jgi:hypothetical protein
MASIAAVVDQALRAANVPIVGVSLGDPANRATWRVLFLPEATDPQKATAQNILDTVVIDAATLADLDAVSDIDQKVLRAVVQGLWETIPGPLLTKLQLRNRILAIYKALP